jgi:hypothetical protein
LNEPQDPAGIGVSLDDFHAYMPQHVYIFVPTREAPPPKTAAFWDIVDANRAPEDAELADTLDRLQNPNAILVHAQHEMSP